MVQFCKKIISHHSKSDYDKRNKNKLRTRSL